MASNQLSVHLRLWTSRAPLKDTHTHTHTQPVVSYPTTSILVVYSYSTNKDRCHANNTNTVEWRGGVSIWNMSSPLPPSPDTQHTINPTINTIVIILALYSLSLIFIIPVDFVLCVHSTHCFVRHTQTDTGRQTDSTQCTVTFDEK